MNYKFGKYFVIRDHGISGYDYQPPRYNEYNYQYGSKSNSNESMSSYSITQNEAKFRSSVSNKSIDHVIYPHVVSGSAMTLNMRYDKIDETLTEVKDDDSPFYRQPADSFFANKLARPPDDMIKHKQKKRQPVSDEVLFHRISYQYSSPPHTPIAPLIKENRKKMREETKNEIQRILSSNASKNRFSDSENKLESNRNFNLVDMNSCESDTSYNTTNFIDSNISPILSQKVPNESKNIEKSKEKKTHSHSSSIKRESNNVSPLIPEQVKYTYTSEQKNKYSNYNSEWSDLKYLDNKIDALIKIDEEIAEKNRISNEQINQQISHSISKSNENSYSNLMNQSPINQYRTKSSVRSTNIKEDSPNSVQKTQSTLNHQNHSTISNKSTKNHRNSLQSSSILKVKDANITKVSNKISSQTMKKSNKKKKAHTSNSSKKPSFIKTENYIEQNKKSIEKEEKPYLFSRLKDSSYDKYSSSSVNHNESTTSNASKKIPAKTKSNSSTLSSKSDSMKSKKSSISSIQDKLTDSQYNPYLYDDETVEQENSQSLKTMNDILENSKESSSYQESPTIDQTLYNNFIEIDEASPISTTKNNNQCSPQSDSKSFLEPSLVKINVEISPLPKKHSSSFSIIDSTVDQSAEFSDGEFDENQSQENQNTNSNNSMNNSEESDDSKVQRTPKFLLQINQTEDSYNTSIDQEINDYINSGNGSKTPECFNAIKNQLQSWNSLSNDSVPSQIFSKNTNEQGQSSKESIATNNCCSPLNYYSTPSSPEIENEQQIISKREKPRKTPSSYKEMSTLKYINQNLMSTKNQSSNIENVQNMNKTKKLEEIPSDSDDEEEDLLASDNEDDDPIPRVNSNKRNEESPKDTLFQYQLPSVSLHSSEVRLLMQDYDDNSNTGRPEIISLCDTEIKEAHQHILSDDERVNKRKRKCQSTLSSLEEQSFNSSEYERNNDSQLRFIYDSIRFEHPNMLYTYNDFISFADDLLYQQMSDVILL